MLRLPIKRVHRHVPISVALGVFMSVVSTIPISVHGQQSCDAAQVRPSDNNELARLLRDDQDDRAGNVQPIDAARKDVARRTRVLQLYTSDSLRTPQDWVRAAFILQHGNVPEHYLLAHELAVAAASQGCGLVATWLAAATEDRFLTSIGRLQRFGTQKFGGNGSHTMIATNRSSLAVTDLVRHAFGVPPLPNDSEVPPLDTMASASGALQDRILTALQDTGGIPLTMASVRQWQHVWSRRQARCRTATDSLAVVQTVMTLAFLPKGQILDERTVDSVLTSAVHAEGLTLSTFLGIQRSKVVADVASQQQMPVPPSTTLGRNILFLREHARDIQAIR